MRHVLPLALLLAVPLLASAAEPPKVEGFAPHAAGVALIEVTGREEYDERSSDGNKGVRFKLKRVRGTDRVFPRDDAFAADVLRRRLSFRYLGKLSHPDLPQALRGATLALTEMPEIQCA